MSKFYKNLNSLPYAKWHEANKLINQIATATSPQEIETCKAVVTAYEAKGQIREALALAKGILDELAQPSELPYCELYELMLLPENKMPLEQIQALPMEEIRKAVEAFLLLSG